MLIQYWAIFLIMMMMWWGCCKVSSSSSSSSSSQSESESQSQSESSLGSQGVGDDCETCDDGTTPDHVKLTIDSIANAECDDCESYQGVHILEQSDSNPCCYTLPLSGCEECAIGATIAIIAVIEQAGRIRPAIIKEGNSGCNAGDDFHLSFNSVIFGSQGDAVCNEIDGTVNIRFGGTSFCNPFAATCGAGDDGPISCRVETHV